MNALIDAMKSLSVAQPFSVGWYLKPFDGEEEYGHNETIPVHSASTRKVSIMMALLAAVRAGKLDLDQPVVIEEQYQRQAHSGCFEHLKPGFRITLQDAMTMMIIVSDNPSTGPIADLLGLDAINAYCASIGMSGTVHRYGHPKDQRTPSSLETSNITTPQDVGRLLDRIVRGVGDASVAEELGVTPELCALAVKTLKAQQYKNKMPLFLPQDVPIAHKTGTRSATHNDVGVVYTKAGEPLFTLATYTDDVPYELEDGSAGRAAAWLFIGRLTRLCYDALAPDAGARRSR